MSVLGGGGMNPGMVALQGLLNVVADPAAYQAKLDELATLEASIEAKNAAVRDSISNAQTLIAEVKVRQAELGEAQAKALADSTLAEAQLDSARSVLAKREEALVKAQAEVKASLAAGAKALADGRAREVEAEAAQSLVRTRGLVVEAERAKVAEARAEAERVLVSARAWWGEIEKLVAAVAAAKPS